MDFVDHSTWRAVAGFPEIALDSGTDGISGCGLHASLSACYFVQLRIAKVKERLPYSCDSTYNVEDKELTQLKNQVDCHDVVNMQYTSGTTAFPKGVMLTHYNISNNGFLTGEHMKFTADDKLCCCVPSIPLFWCSISHHELPDSWLYPSDGRTFRSACSAGIHSQRTLYRTLRSILPCSSPNCTIRCSTCSICPVSAQELWQVRFVPSN